MRITQPYFQVRANGLVVYWLPLNTTHKRHKLPSPEFATYSGKVTSTVKRRLMSALDILVQRADVRAKRSQSSNKLMLNFVTLTLAEQKNLEVKECYDRLLRPWLRYMKDKTGLKDYVWKAEYQKRGQVHYHLATDTILDWRTVRWKWNQIQRRERMLDTFATKYGHFNPNGTDVHPMQSVNDCLAYIAKEMCKDVQNQKVTKGKVWDCSESLKIGRYSTELTTYNEDLLDDAVQHGFADYLELENCVVIKMDDPQGVLSSVQQQEFFNHIS